MATDARRKEVYWARYDAAGRRLEGPRVGRAGSIPGAAELPVAGAGGQLYPEAFGEVIGPAYPDARTLCAIVAGQLRQQAFPPSPAALSPPAPSSPAPPSPAALSPAALSPPAPSPPASLWPACGSRAVAGRGAALPAAAGRQGARAAQAGHAVMSAWPDDARPDKASPHGASRVRLREMNRADMPGIMALEQELFPEDAWTPEMFAAEFAQPASRRLYLVAEEGNALIGYAGMMFTGGSQADVVTLAVNRGRWGKGTGTALLTALVDEAENAATRRSCSRCGRTIPGPGSFTCVTGSPRSGSGAATTSRPASTPWSCGRRSGDGVPAGAWHRDVLRRDRYRAGPRPRPARGFRRLERGGARAVRRRGARGGQPGAPGGDGPDLRPGHRDRGSPAGRDRRRGRHRGAGAGRGPARRGGRGQGVCLRAGQAAVRGQPPGRSHRRRPAGARHAAVARGGPAGVRRAFLAAARAGRGPGGHPARSHHRRRGRRGVRQGGPGARHAIPRRPADRPGGPRRRSRPRSASPGASTTMARSTSRSPA